MLLAIEGTNPSACCLPDDRAEKYEFFPPLHIAVAEGLVDAVRILLAAGADQTLHVPGAFLPALHYAVGARFGYTNDEIAAEMREQQIQKQLGAREIQAVHRAKILEMLLEDCRDKESCTLDGTDNGQLLGETALITAIKAKSSKYVGILLIAKADPNIADAEGFSPLMHAVVSYQHDIVDLLLSAGASTSDTDFVGNRTALHFAVIGRDGPMVSKILKASGDEDETSSFKKAADGYGRTAAEVLEQQRPQVFASLKAFGVPNERLAPPSPPLTTRGCEIPRIPANTLSYKAFVKNYYSVSQPVLLTRPTKTVTVVTDFTSGAAAAMEAFPEYTFESFLERHGDVSATGGGVMPFAEWQHDTMDPNAARQTIRDLFVTKPEGSTGKRAKIVFDEMMVKDNPELSHLRKVRPQFVNNLCGETSEPELISLGQANAGVPPHGHTAAWNVLLFGKKRWFLSAPSDNQKLGSNGDHISTWLDGAYNTRRKEGKVIECVQEPGDLLFIPQGWAHGTLNLEPALAISQEFCGCQNPLHCCGETCSLSAMFNGDVWTTAALRKSQLASRKSIREAMEGNIDGKLLHAKKLEMWKAEQRHKERQA
jgi:hypothetical protein